MEPNSQAPKNRSDIIAKLYRLGMTDQEISQVLNTRTKNINEWRKVRNLEPNLSKQEKKDIQTCLNCTRVNCTGNCLYFMK